MKPAANSKKLALLPAIIVGGFTFWWYFNPYPWLGAVMAVLSGVFVYFILNTRRLERYRRFFFIGIFVVVGASFLVIIRVWDPGFILDWASHHISWMEYYIVGEAPGAQSFPCNRVVSQVFLGDSTYLAGLGTWQVAFPSTMGTFLWVMLPFLATGIIFGRSFCGWICPFGGLPDAMTSGNKASYKMDFLTKDSLSAKGKPYAVLKEWVKDTKFGVLLAVILLSVFLAFPAVCALCPALWLAYLPVFWMVLGLIVIFAVALPILNKHRWWCHICPIGAICSLLDKVSFFRIRIDQQKCIQCMKCVQTCPMYAMAPNNVEGKGKPNMDCIRCGRCMEKCPTEAIDIYWFGTWRKARSIFISLAVIAVLAWYVWFIVIMVDKLGDLF
jgi:polyferredoxin